MLCNIGECTELGNANTEKATAVWITLHSSSAAADLRSISHRREDATDGLTMLVHAIRRGILANRFIDMASHILSRDHKLTGR